MPVTMNPVENSSQISAEGYSPDTGTLVVQFKSGGRYEYTGVPQDAYDAFAGADSKGKALGSIKANYDFRKMKDEDEDPA